MNLETIFTRMRGNLLLMRIGKAASWSLVGAVMQKLFLLGTSVACIKILGKEDFGKMSIVRSTIQIFILLGAVGLGSSATKFTAEYFHAKKKEELTTLYALVYLIALGTGSISLSGVLFFAPRIAEYLKEPALTNAIRIGGVLLFFSIFNSIQTGILTGLEKFREISYIAAIGGVIEFSFITLGAYMKGINGALLGYGVSFLFITLLNEFFIFKNMRANDVSLSLKYATWKFFRALLLFTLPVMGAGLMVSPVVWYTQSILARNAGFSEVGIYTVADQWRMVILFIPSALSKIALPMLSDFFANNNMTEYLKALKYNLKINIFVTGGLIFLIGLASPVIMRIYTLPLSAAIPLILLGVSTIFSAMATVFGQALFSRSRPWCGFGFNILWGGMLIGFSHLYIRYISGATAIALAYLSSYFLHTLFQGIFFYFLIKEPKQS